MTSAYGDTDPVLIACRLISCILSVFGATAIILSYVFFKDSRTFGRKLLLVLSTQDLALSLFYMLPGEAGYGICKFQSVTLTFFSCSSVIWTSIIAFHVFKSVNSGPVEHHEKLMHIVCWSYATACAIGVALLSCAPTSAGWCWVPDSSVEVGLIRLALYYIPLWIIWAFNAVTYAYVHFKIRRMLTLGVSQKQLKHIHAVNRLIFVPIVLVLLRIPGSINRTYVLAVGNGTIYPLTVLQALGDPAQGFADALLFGAFSKRLFRRFFAKLRGIDIENQELTSVTSSSKSNGGLTDDTAEAEAMLGDDGLVRGSGATSPASTMASTVRSVFSSRHYADPDDTETQTQTPYSAML